MHVRAPLGRTAIIAIGCAVVALLTSLVAVVVVAMRAPAAPATAVARGPEDQRVAAADVNKLKRGAVAMARDRDGAVRGATITDPALRAALGLEADDVITALGGRAIARELDVYDAVLGIGTMDASIVYVDLLRAGRPTLVRWTLDGELRAARRDPPRRPTLGVLGATPDPNASALGSLGGGSVDVFGSPRASRDPLLDTIVRIDDLHYEVPRATVERLLANTDAFARQARIVPAFRNGQPDGFKLYAIRPGSLWATIGVRNGDTIQAINGHALTTGDAALDAYVKVRDATTVELALRRGRGGAAEVVTITVK